MRSIAAFLLVSAPWLNPFSIGPTPAVMPLLFSWGCAVVMLVLLSGWKESSSEGALQVVVARAWLAAALLSASIGLFQYFEATAIFGPWVNRTHFGEAFANLRQRNQFATLTNIGMAALLWHVAVRPARSTWWWVVAALLLAAGNAASSSRTGIVEMLALSAVVAVWGGWRQVAVRRILLAALFGYAVFAVLLPVLAGLDVSRAGMLARLQTGDAVCSSRVTLWKNVVYLIAQKPWFGWGHGELDFAHFMTLYPGARFCDILDNAHNLPLHIAVEFGVPAAVVSCGAAIWLAVRAKPWREADPTRQMAWLVLGVILLHSMLEYPLWYGPFQMAMGLCVWLLCRSTTCDRSRVDAPRASQEHATQISPVSRAAMPAAAVLALAFIAYAVWDYRRIGQIYIASGLRAPAYRENTLEKIRDSWLFRNQVMFAEFTIAYLTRQNAAEINSMAHALLHFSPEALVVEKLIESAVMLGRDGEAVEFLRRYRAAFPQSYARWSKEKASPTVPALPAE